MGIYQHVVGVNLLMQQVPAMQRLHRLGQLASNIQALREARLGMAPPNRRRSPSTRFIK